LASEVGLGQLQPGAARQPGSMAPVALTDQVRRAPAVKLAFHPLPLLPLSIFSITTQKCAALIIEARTTRPLYYRLLSRISRLNPLPSKRFLQPVYIYIAVALPLSACHSPRLGRILHDPFASQPHVTVSRSSVRDPSFGDNVPRGRCDSSLLGARALIEGREPAPVLTLCYHGGAIRRSCPASSAASARRGDGTKED
jgi:hypothetical protein